MIAFSECLLLSFPLPGVFLKNQIMAATESIANTTSLNTLLDNVTESCSACLDDVTEMTSVEEPKVKWLPWDNPDMLITQDTVLLIEKVKKESVSV